MSILVVFVFSFICVNALSGGVNRHPYSSFFRNPIVPPSEYPFTVAISRDGTEKDMCNGVLVRENFVLTTAQCVVGTKQPVRILVRYREKYRKLQPEAVYLHSNVSSSLYDDIALLKLPSRSMSIWKGFKPIAISNSRNLGQIHPIVTGFVRGENGRPQYLKRDKVTLLPKKNCERSNILMGSTEMCGSVSIYYLQNAAIYNYGRFDSGSPLVIDYHQNYTLLGIVSNKPWTKNTHYIKFLNIVFYKKWIEQIFGENNFTIAEPVVNKPTEDSFLGMSTTEVHRKATASGDLVDSTIPSTGVPLELSTSGATKPITTSPSENSNNNEGVGAITEKTATSTTKRENFTEVKTSKKVTVTDSVTSGESRPTLTTSIVNQEVYSSNEEMNVSVSTSEKPGMRVTYSTVSGATETNMTFSLDNLNNSEGAGSITEDIETSTTNHGNFGEVSISTMEAVTKLDTFEVSRSTLTTSVVNQDIYVSNDKFNTTVFTTGEPEKGASHSIVSTPTKPNLTTSFDNSTNSGGAGSITEEMETSSTKLENFEEVPSSTVEIVTDLNTSEADEPALTLFTVNQDVYGSNQEINMSVSTVEGPEMEATYSTVFRATEPTTSTSFDNINNSEGVGSITEKIETSTKKRGDFGEVTITTIEVVTDLGTSGTRRPTLTTSIVNQDVYGSNEEINKTLSTTEQPQKRTTHFTLSTATEPTTFFGNSNSEGAGSITEETETSTITAENFEEVSTSTVENITDLNASEAGEPTLTPLMVNQNVYGSNEDMNLSVSIKEGPGMKATYSTVSGVTEPTITTSFDNIKNSEEAGSITEKIESSTIRSEDYGGVSISTKETVKDSGTSEPKIKLTFSSIFEAREPTTIPSLGILHNSEKAEYITEKMEHSTAKRGNFEEELIPTTETVTELSITKASRPTLFPSIMDQEVYGSNKEINDRVSTTNEPEMRDSYSTAFGEIEQNITNTLNNLNNSEEVGSITKHIETSTVKQEDFGEVSISTNETIKDLETFEAGEPALTTSMVNSSEYDSNEEINMTMSEKSEVKVIYSLISGPTEPTITNALGNSNNSGGEGSTIGEIKNSTTKRENFEEVAISKIGTITDLGTAEAREPTSTTSMANQLVHASNERINITVSTIQESEMGAIYSTVSGATEPSITKATTLFNNTGVLNIKDQNESSKPFLTILAQYNHLPEPIDIEESQRQDDNEFHYGESKGRVARDHFQNFDYVGTHSGNSSNGITVDNLTSTKNKFNDTSSRYISTFFNQTGKPVDVTGWDSSFTILLRFFPKLFHFVHNSTAESSKTFIL